MKTTRREHLALLGAAATTALLPARVGADSHAASGPVTHEIQMLNKDGKERMVFRPDLLHVNLGDTVKFVNADRGHNSQCDDKGAPEGGNLWSGKINEEVEVTFDTEGTYTFYCRPHRSAGMVGVVLVGDPSSNYEDAKGQRFPGRAKKRYQDIFERADAMIAEKDNA